MNRKLRYLIILCILATMGVVALQIQWLTTSYQIGKEKLKIDANKILDDAILKHKELVADTVRDLLKKAIDPKDIETKVHYKMSDSQHVAVGYRTKRHQDGSWIILKVSLQELKEIQLNPYPNLLKRINEDNLDHLYGVYSTFVGAVDDVPGSREQLLQDSLMRKFELHNDTVTLKRILREKFNAIHENLIFSITHLVGIDRIYNNNVKPPDRYKGLPSKAIEVPRSRLRGATLTQKLDSLSFYIDKLNTDRNYLYVYKTFLDDINAILQDKVSVFILAIKVPKSYIFSQMLFSIIGSGVLLLLTGFCLTNMFYTILKQKKLSEIKDDFINNVSHELKTPVATTLAAIQGMQHFDVLKDEDKTKQYLSTAAKEMQRLSSMIDTILNSSVYERRDFELQFVEFNLKALLKELINTQLLYSRKDVSIELNYAIKEEIIADQTHMHNVILNLIDNSIKYGNEKVKLKIECIESSSGIKILFIDNGIGIPSHYQKHIFDKFFRVPRPNDHSVKGHGLGLSYVKRIIELHNGTIRLIKSDELGTSFEIDLPQ